MFSNKKVADYSELDTESRNKKAKSYLLWILSKRDYTQKTLEKKLKDRKLSDDEIGSLIEQLIEDKLFNPDSYYIYQVRHLANEGYSEFGIKAKLFKLGHSIEQSKLLEIIQSERIDLNRSKEAFFKKCLNKYDLNQDSKNQTKTKLVHRAIKKIESRGYRQSDLWEAIENLS